MFLYVGEVFKKDEHEETCSHDCTYTTVLNQDIVCAKRFANISRYINQSCDPNCELRHTKVDGIHSVVYVIALQPITKGNYIFI
jgi:SET domain-containing protein